MMMALPDVLGLIGVFFTLVAYLLLSIRKMSSHSVGYPSLNMIGSALIIYSLYYDWNISAFVMEVCWMLISIYGFYKVVT
jgi:paired small multidrug resistance pump